MNNSEDEKMGKSINNHINIPRGISEGGAALHEDDHSGYIGLLPTKKANPIGNYGCLVRLTEGDAVTYQYKSVSLDSEVAQEVQETGVLPDAVRKSLEGEIVPGTELFTTNGSYKSHKDYLKYAASHLNNGNARSSSEVDIAFTAARDLVDAVVFLATPRNEATMYGSTVCNL
ncbi:hypothetical protein HOC35_03490 [Candidatus Woesearchaeota archaeon]|jgi:hypothetical protein|nr:hypothetical protein [Candidatus Woesearchaeota archaeon]